MITLQQTEVTKRLGQLNRNGWLYAFRGFLREKYDLPAKSAFHCCFNKFLTRGLEVYLSYSTQAARISLTNITTCSENL